MKGVIKSLKVPAAVDIGRLHLTWVSGLWAPAWCGLNKCVCGVSTRECDLVCAAGGVG